MRAGAGVAPARDREGEWIRTPSVTRPYEVFPCLSP
jgi:hypothetical protein